MFTSRFRIRALCLAAAVMLSIGAACKSQEELPRALSPAGPDSKVQSDKFEKLYKHICPQPDESKWAKIPWLTNLAEARKKSVELNKPLLLWRAGGGDVLGRA